MVTWAATACFTKSGEKLAIRLGGEHEAGRHRQPVRRHPGQRGAFPAGLVQHEIKLKEIEASVRDGAQEIDIVITREHVLTGNWQALYGELKAMREACGPAHMKAILATGDLKTLSNVYKASMVAMQAGSDFIKTSTGKEDVNATLPVSLTIRAST